jgi:hypothetical protein
VTPAEILEERKEMRAELARLTWRPDGWLAMRLDAWGAWFGRALVHQVRYQWRTL